MSSIKSLTGIRGAAALWVLAYHLEMYRDFLNLPSIPVLTEGWRGVDLFFILSGFVLAYAHPGEFSITEFAKKRFLRIYPVPTAVLALIVLGLALDPALKAWLEHSDHNVNHSVLALVSTLTLTTRIFPITEGDWNGPTWSLSFEILGYATFPFLMLWARKVTTATGALLIAVAATTALVAFNALMGELNVNELGTLAIFRFFGCFITGTMLHRAYSLLTAKGFRMPAYAESVAVTGLALTSFVPALQAIAIPCLALLIFALAFRSGPVARLLESKPAMFLGNISFPLYLVHVLPLQWIAFHHGGASGFQSAAIVIAYLAVVILAATVLHRLVERPCQSRSRKASRAQPAFA